MIEQCNCLCDGSLFCKIVNDYVMGKTSGIERKQDELVMSELQQVAILFSVGGIRDY